MNINKIRIEDKELFDRYLKNMASLGSEMTFASLFMWKHDYNFCWSIIEEHLCLVSNCSTYKPFIFFPMFLGDYNAEKMKSVILKIQDFFKEKNWTLFFGRVDQTRVNLLKEIEDIKFEFIEDEDTFDYIYTSKKLAFLKGRKLSSKRNHINRFIREHEKFKYEPINSSNIDIVLKLAKKLSEYTGGEKEYEAYDRVLKNWEHFDLKGALYSVNGEYEGFTIGEKSFTDMAIIHVEKASKDIMGLFPTINKDFVEREWLDVKYINREEDMGIEGLRKAKLSYYPDIVLKKYIVNILS